MTFEEWHKEKAKYMESVDIVHWCAAAWAAGAAAEREACAQIVEREASQYAEPTWAVEILNDMCARGENV